MNWKDLLALVGKPEPVREQPPEEIVAERIAEAKQTGATELDLSDLGLSTWPVALGELKQLRELYLHGNQLRNLPDALGEFKQLRGLRLNKNQLRELPDALGELKQLQVLRLDGNQLRELPAILGELKQLQQLWLSGNQLRELPAALGELKQLRLLILDGNLDLGLPQEVQLKWDSPQKILDYYFSQKKRAEASGTRPLNEAKVLVLGEAAVGKSSLIHALTEGLSVPDFSKTQGIVQKPWRLPLHDGRLARDGEPGAEELRLNLWDFGGQEVYHSTHAFFLTRRAVYLLVADARANDRQNNLEYWLQMAASFGAGAPVWVAVNKCDQHGAGPDEHALRRKFPAIRGFLRTSCKSGAGIEALKQTLAAEALGLEGVRQPMNNIWLGIKQALEDSKADTISLEEYRALCREHGETEEGMPEKLLDLWDKLGTVRYFPLRPDDPPEMRDSAILNPEWVTKAVYAVLDDAAVRAAGGLATGGDFQRILQAGGYPPERHRMIEQVMRRFDLLYDTTEYEPSQRMLVPQLLPEREPAHAWPAQGTLCFVYKYPVLPAGLVPGFIARRHRLLSRAPGPWRHGCVLDFPTKARARVIGDAEQKKVTIAVQGEPIAARDALNTVRATFEGMHSAIVGLEVEELIPVPGDPDAPLLSYRLIQRLHDNGITTHFASGSGQNEVITVDVTALVSITEGPRRKLQTPNESD